MENNIVNENEENHATAIDKSSSSESINENIKRSAEENISSDTVVNSQTVKSTVPNALSSNKRENDIGRFNQNLENIKKDSYHSKEGARKTTGKTGKYFENSSYQRKPFYNAYDGRERGDKDGKDFSKFGKKIDRIKANKLEVDYKKPEILKEFLTEKGKILSRYITGNSTKNQKRLVREIKKARYIGLLPSA